MIKFINIVFLLFYKIKLLHMSRIAHATWKIIDRIGLNSISWQTQTVFLHNSYGLFLILRIEQFDLNYVTEVTRILSALRIWIKIGPLTNTIVRFHWEPAKLLAPFHFWYHNLENVFRSLWHQKSHICSSLFKYGLLRS